MGKIDEVLDIVRLIQIDVAEIKKRLESGIEQTSSVVRMDGVLKFPLCSKEDLSQFEEELGLEEKFNEYATRFRDDLTSVRLPRTTYNRRKSLKELLFSR